LGTAKGINMITMLQTVSLVRFSFLMGWQGLSIICLLNAGSSENYQKGFATSKGFGKTVTPKAGKNYQLRSADHFAAMTADRSHH